MEHITSRGFSLPESPEELADRFWLNLWHYRLWPYRELVPGDVLYWYESPNKRISWKTRVSEVDRFPYHSKDDAADRLQSRFGTFDHHQPYWVGAPKQGVCLAWKVIPLQRLDLPKPEGLRFPQQGWLRVQDDVVRCWLSQLQPVDTATLDEAAPDKETLLERLRALNEAMVEVSPERVRSLVSQTLRRDTRLVNTLKELCQFRCQFPGCGVRIPRRDGTFYIEVAHIQPLSGGGRSVLGNLLVLCPNHHKEFDYGHPKILEQTWDSVRGTLNGRDFEISLPGARITT